MTSKTVSVDIRREGSMCFIPVPFDPRQVFGKVRAPVAVTLNGYTFRSTIFSMGGVVCIPLRKSNREAAGLSGGETLDVKIALDTRARTVEMPADLKKALAGKGALRKAWDALSFTHQREHAEALLSAKKPETRARRLAGTLALLSQRMAQRKGATKATGKRRP
jgi:hypothetical protein